MQPLQSCSLCGAEYPDHARFCGKCGHPFKTPIPSQESTLPITTLRAKPLAEVPLMPENTPEQTLSPSIARCLEDDQAERERVYIAEHRFLIVKHLLVLLPFVDEEHQAANKKLFETLILTSPPITEPSWERITLIAGVYGRNMYKLPLNKEQKQGLWEALVWALWYEHFFRPKKVKDRLHDLLVFLKGCSWDSEFLASTVPDIDQIILLLDVNSLKKLQDALSNLSSSVLPDLNQLCEEIEARISLYTTLPPTDQLSPLSSKPSEADSEITQMIATIELHQPLLDKKSESHNQNLLKQACHESYQPLAFLSEDQRAILLENMRHSRLDQVTDFLQRVRQPLLSALSQTLFDPTFEEFLPPRHGLHISGKNGSDPFSQAKTWITGSQREEWQKALHIFEHAEQEKTRRDDALLAREWVHFAQAHVSDPINVIPDWEENRRRGMASWEEIWNLAVFYVRIKRTSQALEVLASGVKVLTAPFSHLCFALYCGTQILEHASKYSAEIVEQAAAFLCEYLTFLPIPECYLVCFLLLQGKQQKPDTLAQSHLLSMLQALLDAPITLLHPEETLSDNKVEAFKKDLLRLKLTDLWRLWIHDYAQRHPFTAKAWQAFSEVCEQVGQLEQAEQALLHIVKMYHKQYKDQIKQRQQQEQAEKGTPQKDLQNFRRRLSASLIRLFEFYRRAGWQRQGHQSFTLYQQSVPEFWDERDSSNNYLLALSRPYLETISAAKTASTPAELPQISWSSLTEELAHVQTISDLKPLQTRLNLAIDSFVATQKAVAERATPIRLLLAELCKLDLATRQRDDLLHEAKRLNGAIQQAYKLIEQEASLKQLRPLISACKRAFAHICQARQLVPRPYMNPTPLGLGLPDDLTETSLVLHITNPGPGDLTNIQLSCTDKGLIASRKEVILDVLPERGEDLVALPVSMLSTVSKQVDCQIHFTYQWGLLHNETCSYPLITRWFRFHDFLQHHQIHEYEIPNPYVFDTAIHFAKHDPRLFQGRESELNLIRSIFLKGQMVGAAPLYFHGIRKVGKTSLLHRIALELKKGNIVPLVVDLHGIKADQQPLGVIINSLTTRMLANAEEQDIDVEGIKPVAVGHANPIFGVERFFKALRERTGRRQLVILLDEFHLIVAEHTTTLLDLMRRIHQSDLILFIMSGWQRPETMRRACPETQLFPLMARPLDFLPLEAVRQVLHAPIADFGIDIPEATVRRVYLQTAGNPYHVAKISWEGISRLNAEHRTVLAPQDIDEFATKLANDPANFTSSSFSPLIFTYEEQTAAIRFAKELNNHRDFLPLDDACNLFGSLDMIQCLEEKYVLELQADRLRIRGKMLATYLQNRRTNPLTAPVQTVKRQRVGLFVDYENLFPLLPDRLKFNSKEVGEALVHYASRYGTVVCRWACYDPRNIPNVALTKPGLEQANFQVQYPRGEPQTGQAPKNLTDFVLLERITAESIDSEPDIYILVSGDKDYYEKIIGLLERGNMVRLVASISNAHLAKKYKALEARRLRARHAEGHTESDFSIDNLDDILSNAMTPA